MTERTLPNLEIANYFNHQGYEIIELTQPWRHVIGKVRKGNNDYFLKLATTPEIAERTRSEFAWNGMMNTGIIELPVGVSKPFESGDYNNLFWFTSEFIVGVDIANPTKPNNVSVLINVLPQIVKTSHAILQLPAGELLPRDRSEKDMTLEDKILGKMKSWQKEIRSKDVTPLIEFANSRLQYLQTAPQHGDFVPWHFKISENGKLYLFDAEAAAMNGVKFYDIAYFFHRVYTKLKRPDIARTFINEVVKVIPLSTEDAESLRLAIAQRLVGGYFDAESDNTTSMELQDQMSRQLLEGDII